jgi:two-component sensor histidine kinase
LTGRIKHFTTADGLASGLFRDAFRDRNGVLWFGMTQGLSRFTPAPDEQAAPPSILITGVSVAGTGRLVSALGETQMSLAELSPNENQLQMDFVGLNFVPGEVLRYQHKLEGADQDWSSPNELRVVNYANLAPGRYRFLVRTINSNDDVSAIPAALTFTILRPLWQRWWFLTLAAGILCVMVYLLYRYRLTRLLEMANMRTRIATDLHDDIGANLTRITILSEVARQQFANGKESNGHPLSSIADIARESVASMSDIVWAINPERDSLRDLIRKMRQHADEIFTLREIDLDFQAPSSEFHLKLGADLRRNLLLLFKEAVNNAARHSRCSRVRIDFRLEGSSLNLLIEDNGLGFDTSLANEGHGLVSMQRRAKDLAATFEVVSAIGNGTIVRIRIPAATVRARR